MKKIIKNIQLITFISKSMNLYYIRAIINYPTSHDVESKLRQSACSIRSARHSSTKMSKSGQLSRKQYHRQKHAIKKWVQHSNIISGQIKKHEIGRYVAHTGELQIYTKKKLVIKPETEKKLYCFYQAAMLQDNRPSNISSIRQNF